MVNPITRSPPRPIQEVPMLRSRLVLLLLPLTLAIGGAVSCTDSETPSNTGSAGSGSAGLSGGTAGATPGAAGSGTAGTSGTAGSGAAGSPTAGSGAAGSGAAGSGTAGSGGVLSFATDIAPIIASKCS